MARGHRWLAMLESGTVKSLNEVAACERICSSYVSRMLNLTLLAPEIVAAILDDELPDHVTLFELAVDSARCGSSSGRGLLWLNDSSRIGAVTKLTSRRSCSARNRALARSPPG